MYSIVFPLLWDFMRKTLRPKAEPHLRGQQNRSLTLIGFTVTALALLVRLYSDSSPPLEGCAISLALSLFFFSGSYIILRFRVREWCGYWSSAFLDSGLWCLFIAVAFLFSRVIRSRCAVALIAVLMIGFLVFVAVDLTLYIRYVRKLAASQKGGVRDADSSVV
jgi:hypothetical protein